MKDKKFKIIGVVVIATIFGFISGLVGAIVARVNLLENAYDIPWFGEISYLDTDNSRSSLVIRNAKKVVVEEDDRVSEVADLVSSGIIGIYKNKNIKIDKENTNNDFNLDDYYLASDRLAEGFVVTSDGWIVSNFLPDGLEKALNNKDKGEAFFSDFVVITDDGSISEIDKILFDENIPYSFWHIISNDLPVRNFVKGVDLQNGQSVVVVDSHGRVLISHILDKAKVGDQDIRNSDNYSKRIIISANDNIEIDDLFLFDLNGGLVGLFDSLGEIYSVDNFVPIINNLLKNKEIKRSVFGVNYIDLSQVISVTEDNVSQIGAMIYGDGKNVAIQKNSPAEKAGFQEGDIIVAVNNIAIDEKNDLAYVLSGFMYGDEVTMTFLRDGKKGSMEVVLGE